MMMHGNIQDYLYKNMQFTIQNYYGENQKPFEAKSTSSDFIKMFKFAHKIGTAITVNDDYVEIAEDGAFKVSKVITNGDGSKIFHSFDYHSGAFFLENNDVYFVD